MSERWILPDKKEKEDKRFKYAIEQLNKLGYDVKYICRGLEFTHKGHQVKLYPYRGWFTGKTIKDGRGIANLLKQLR